MADTEAGKVLGVGGLFLACADKSKTLAWYRDVLGMKPNDYGGFDFLHRGSADAFPQAARTIFGIFDDDTPYFQPSTLSYMLNLIVDDLDAVLARAEAAGATQVQDRENTDYGDFAWLVDPDGRKVELWQPKEPQAGQESQ